MRKIKQILRYKWVAGQSNRTIARAIKVGRETVSDYLFRAKRAGLHSWDQVSEMDEGTLEQRLFPNSDKDGKRVSGKRMPNWQDIRRELGKSKGVTLLLLWQEYYAVEPGTAYSYSQFCYYYRVWNGKLPAAMVQTYKAGERLFVDYAGETVAYVDRATGETRYAQIFVASLGLSNYTYAEAQKDQKLSSWISGHIKALKWLGGVPQIVVPDNLKSGVTSPSYYEPEINPTYDALALHYGFVVIPARRRKAKDKAKVETGVQTVERWVLAPLRNMKFFSIQEINEAMAPLLEQLNTKEMKHLEKSRRGLFEAFDLPALGPLPKSNFETAENKLTTVGLNYHVKYKKHGYSVPYRLIKETVEIRATADTVEIFHKGTRVASHLRDDTPGSYTTCETHMPPNHRWRNKEWSTQKFLQKAQSIGPQTYHVIQTVLRSKRHPEQGYRACLGILRLSGKYGEERLERACDRAARYNLYTYKQIHNILKNNMDMTAPVPQPSKATEAHEHIRGQAYYH